MEKPNATTTALFEKSVPDDPRAVRGQMFGHPCAYVNGNMFFGTFGQSLLVRVGEGRAADLARPPIVVFHPPHGGVWKEYVQILPGSVPEQDVADLAAEALSYTAGLPPKVKKEKAAPKAKKPKKASS